MEMSIRTKSSLLSTALIAVFTVLAIGQRWVDDPRISQYSYDPNSPGSQGYGFLRAASLMPSAKSVVRPPTLFDLQAGVLQLVWYFSSATPLSAWNATGFNRRSGRAVTDADGTD